MKNKIMEIIEDYGYDFDPSQDMNIAEAMSIIDASKTKIEIAENAYLYGHMRGSCENGFSRQIPFYNLKQMSDEEWQEMAIRNKMEREAMV